jgi:hypothetical protein
MKQLLAPQSLKKLSVHFCLLLACVVFALLFFHNVTLSRTATFLTFPDNSIQSYAWLTKVSTTWRNAELPLWDFNVNSGTSFVGELQTAGFYPLNILFACFSRPGNQYAIDVYIALHYALASYLMLLFLRMNKLKLIPSMMGAIIYAYIGTIAQKASGQSNIFMGMVYLPIVLGFFQKGLRSGLVLRNRWLYLSGIALAFSLLAGHMQPYVHGAIALFILMVFTCYRTPDYSWRLAVAQLAFVGLVSVLFAAIQLIPTVEYLAHSYRWIGLPDPIRGLARPPYAVYGFAEALNIRELLSLLKPMSDIKDGATLFVSISGLVLAGVGCFARKRLRWFAIAVALLSVLVALGGHTFLGRVFWHIPILNLVREPVRMLFLYQFAVALLAAMGAQWLLENVPRQRWQTAALAGAMLLLVVFEIFAQQDRLLQPNGSGLTPNSYYARNQVIDFLARQSAGDGDMYRIINYENALPENIGDVYRHIHSTSGHRATMSAPYFQYLSRDWKPGSAIFDRLGAKYIVSQKPLQDFRQVLMAEGFYVYERDRPLPVMQLLTNQQQLKPAQVSAVKWSQNSVAFTIENSEPGQLLFAQPYYPGWRVYVDGQARSVIRSDVLMAVQLSGNEKRVVWVYSPYWVWVGLGTFILVLGGLLISLPWQRAERRG